MWYGKQDIEIWRQLPASGTWQASEPDYAYHHTIRGVTVQPFSSNQMIRNNQLFANVIGIITCKITDDIIDGDELVYLKDSSYGRVQVMEPWDSGIMPHKEVYVTYAQWDRS